MQSIATGRFMEELSRLILKSFVLARLAIRASLVYGFDMELSLAT